MRQGPSHRFAVVGAFFSGLLPGDRKRESEEAGVTRTDGESGTLEGERRSRHGDTGGLRIACGRSFEAKEGGRQGVEHETAGWGGVGGRGGGTKRKEAKTDAPTSLCRDSENERARRTKGSKRQGERGEDGRDTGHEDGPDRTTGGGLQAEEISKSMDP